MKIILKKVFQNNFQTLYFFQNKMNRQLFLKYLKQGFYEELKQGFSEELKQGFSEELRII